MSDSDQRSKCSCFYVSEHTGQEARAYIAEHLEEVRVDSARWTTEYRCPLYGKRWLSEDSWAEMHGGTLRLRTFERVCREVKGALNAAHALLVGQHQAEGHVQALLDALGPCQEM